MAKLLVALESMKIYQPEKDDSDGDDGDAYLNSVLVDAAEAEMEVCKDVKMIEEATDDFVMVEEAVERLEGLRNAIEKHGICKSMMEVVDPDAELVSAGLVPAYENLNDVPTKDENSVLTMKGIDTAIRATSMVSTLGVVTAAAIAALLIPIIHFLFVSAKRMIDLSSSCGTAIKAYLTALDTVEKKLVQKTDLVDNAKLEERLKKVTVSSYSKENFGKAIGAGEHVAKLAEGGILVKLAEEVAVLLESSSVTEDHVKTISKKAGDFAKTLENDPMIKGLFGVEVSLKDGELESVSRKTPEIKVEKSGLEELGWKSGDAIPTVHEAIALIKSCEIAANRIKTAGETYKKLADSLKSHTKKDKKMSSEEKAAFKKCILLIHELINANGILSTILVDATRYVSTSALSVGKAVLSARSFHGMI